MITGSSAMFAEGVHSLADCGNQVLLLLGMKRAQRPANPDYPLGHGKEIYFWSFLVAVMLFTVGGMFSFYEGWHKLQSTEPLNYPWLAIGVLTFGIIAESVSMRACLAEVKKARGELSLWRWFRTSRQAELVVIFGEDLAALLGLVFALLAVVATMITGNPIYDAIGTPGHRRVADHRCDLRGHRGQGHADRAERGTACSARRSASSSPGARKSSRSSA